MKTTMFACCLMLTALLTTTVPTGQAAPGEWTTDGSAGVSKSISGSYVYLNAAVSPNDCFSSCGLQWFCFQGVSLTNDNDYVYYLWLRFPDDWVVNDVALYDVPYCTSGGVFGPFGWYAPSNNEVRIQHVRYQAANDACTAYYCVQVAPGSPSPGQSYAWVSWYWQSSVYGSPPFNPCSSDGYTPAGQPACDEMNTVPAYIGQCESLFCDDFETGNTSAWAGAVP